MGQRRRRWDWFFYNDDEISDGDLGFTDQINLSQNGDKEELVVADYFNDLSLRASGELVRLPLRKVTSVEPGHTISLTYAAGMLYLQFQ